MASSRAVLLALLLPDPCDPDCPAQFKSKARDLLLGMLDFASSWESTVETDSDLGKALLKFIADFANWYNAARSEYLETGRGLVQAGHPEETPLVVDPFAGGDSISLEALRLGCEAFANDLSPVACLIVKVMLEDIHRHGPGLGDELRKAGAEIKAKVEKELADLYPKDPDGANPYRLLVGPHRALRGPRLRGRDSPAPLFVALSKCRLQVSTTSPSGAGGWHATRGGF